MRIGVDLGGTKTEAVALGSAGEEMGRLRADTPPDGYDGIVLGVAELVADETANDWMHRADEALYEAKRAGRNTTSVAV